ncbi:glutathionylspermidine synthase family protein [Clostridium sp. DL1XJH146]
MRFDELNREFINWVKDNKELFLEDAIEIEEKVKNSGLIFGGVPIPYLTHPHFLSKDDVEIFKGLAKDLSGILNKVIEKYCDDKEFRNKFGFTKEMEELILLDYGYNKNFPMARFDVFYYPDSSFKFCELNGDGSAGMNRPDKLDSIIIESKGMKNLEKKYKFNKLELINSWVEESLKNFNDFAYNNNLKNDKPNVAIVDWETAGNQLEFRVFKAAYEDKGCKCEVVDPRELKLQEDGLYFGDFKVDMIYRRLVTSELVENSEELNDLIQSYKEKKVCFVGPVRSQIIHDKIIFRILHEECDDILTDEEKAFVENHIPYTATLTFNNYDKIKVNKDKYVLKPRDLYAAKGVYIGKDYSEKEWEDLLHETVETGYLVQEFIKPYSIELAVIKDNDVVFESFNTMLGLFVYNEEFKGVYTRVSQFNEISNKNGYYILANPAVY